VKAQSSLFQQINHIVVVMLENRSFDHMLGYLYADSGNVSPLGQPFEGLTGKESNPDGKGSEVSVYKIQGTDPHPYFMPGANPGEGYLNTNSQLFGTTQAPSPPVPAANRGFVTNFAYTIGWESKTPNEVLPGTQPSQIMGTYTPQMLPILSSLAKGFAVCDQWFSSVPTETFPNRAFVCLATSQGHVSDSTCKTYTAPSIFTSLEKKGASWGVYGYDAPPLTRGSVSDIMHAAESHFGEFADFQTAARGGLLPNYVFLEPQWGSNGNSQHPNYDVAKGEQFLHDIYYSLYGTKSWQNTLLIITYDEHGGCYDHVPPPENAIAPDNSVGELGFDFKRFGVRVPTVLVSPLIEAGTVFRPPSSPAGSTSALPFDHTSILSTVEQRFGLPNLTQRDAAAPDVGGVITRTTARADDPLNGVTVPISKAVPQMASGPDHLERALAESAHDLPVSEGAGNGHRHEMPFFATGKEAINYARQRYRSYRRSR